MGDATEQGSKTSTNRSTAVERRAGNDGDTGKNIIADVVVQKIAGIATREVPGVHDLGGGAQRAFHAVRERIPGATTNVAQGVGVEVGDAEAAVDLDIVVTYGVAIDEVASGIRRNVISAVERMTGLSVIEVNINVVDIDVPDENGGDQEARVQ